MVTWFEFGLPVMEIKSAINMSKNMEHKIPIKYTLLHIWMPQRCSLWILLNASFPSLKQKGTENYDKRAVNCNRLLLRLTDSCPAHFSVQPLKGAANSLLCQEILLCCKPAIQNKDRYQGAMAETLAQLKTPCFFSIDSSGVHFTFHLHIKQLELDWWTTY